MVARGGGFKGARCLAVAAATVLLLVLDTVPAGAGCCDTPTACFDTGCSVSMRRRPRMRLMWPSTTGMSPDVSSDSSMKSSAARSDISEEVARFRGHVSHWVSLADAAEPCGRKLDFLLQEMNREVNTMGSKADGLRVSELVITAKAELEKMREQVQNVE